MPKQTFYNLSAEKRQKFVQATLEEFALYDYNSASLNRVANVADIAKGSIYQYFENKQDLYEYLVNNIANEKFTYILLNLPDNTTDFSELLVSILTLYCKFDLTNPLKSRLLYNALNEKNTDELSDIHNLLIEGIDTLFIDFVQNAQNLNLIRTDIKSEFIGVILSRFILIIPDLLEEQLGFSYLGLVLNDSRDKLDEIVEVLKRIVSVFMWGLSPK